MAAYEVSAAELPKLQTRGRHSRPSWGLHFDDPNIEAEYSKKISCEAPPASKGANRTGAAAIGRRGKSIQYGGVTARKLFAQARCSRKPNTTASCELRTAGRAGHGGIATEAITTVRTAMEPEVVDVVAEILATTVGVTLIGVLSLLGS